MDQAIQLAAELNKRGLHVSVDLNIVLVWIEGSDPMMITPRGTTTNDYGEKWSWQYVGKAGSHSRYDAKGAAEAVAQFLITNFVLKEPPCQDDQ